jgi:hypothetical protein
VFCVYLILRAACAGGATGRPVLSEGLISFCGGRLFARGLASAFAWLTPRRSYGWQTNLCSTFTSFVPYRMPSAIILASPKTSISASKSITKANRSTRPSMALGNSQLIWQCHPKRKLLISSTILNQAQDGHFYSVIFFEEQFVAPTSAKR